MPSGIPKSQPPAQGPPLVRVCQWRRECQTRRTDTPGGAGLCWCPSLGGTGGAPHEGCRPMCPWWGPWAQAGRRASPGGREAERREWGARGLLPGVPWRPLQAAPGTPGGAGGARTRSQLRGACGRCRGGAGRRGSAGAVEGRMLCCRTTSANPLRAPPALPGPSLPCSPRIYELLCACRAPFPILLRVPPLQSPRTAPPRPRSRGRRSAARPAVRRPGVAISRVSLGLCLCLRGACLQGQGPGQVQPKGVPRLGHGPWTMGHGQWASKGFS